MSSPRSTKRKTGSAASGRKTAATKSGGAKGKAGTTRKFVRNPPNCSKWTNKDGSLKNKVELREEAKLAGVDKWYKLNKKELCAALNRKRPAGRGTSAGRKTPGGAAAAAKKKPPTAARKKPPTAARKTPTAARKTPSTPGRKTGAAAGAKKPTSGKGSRGPRPASVHCVGELEGLKKAELTQRAVGRGFDSAVKRLTNEQICALLNFEPGSRGPSAKLARYAPEGYFSGSSDGESSESETLSESDSGSSTGGRRKTVRTRRI